MIKKHIPCSSSIWFFCLFATLSSPLQASRQKQSTTIKPTKGRIRPRKPRPQGRPTAKGRPQNKPAPSARPQPQTRPRPETQRYNNSPPYVPPQRGGRPAPMQNGQFSPHNQQMNPGMPGGNMPIEQENTHSIGKFFVRWITFILVEAGLIGLGIVIVGMPGRVEGLVIVAVGLFLAAMVMHYICELAVYLVYGSSSSSEPQQPAQPPMRQGPQNQGPMGARFSVPR